MDRGETERAAFRQALSKVFHRSPSLSRASYQRISHLDHRQTLRIRCLAEAVCGRPELGLAAAGLASLPGIPLQAGGAILGRRDRSAATDAGDGAAVWRTGCTRPGR